MSLICVIAAYNEADMIERAVTSAFEAGCDAVHVFDGPWDGFGYGMSTDGTMSVSVVAGAVFHAESHGGTQGGKRTAMFHHCGAMHGDHVLSLDADETLEGRFPPLEPHHYNLILQNQAENDLPGIRGEWPDGDGGLKPFPLLRLFFYGPDLHCATGGAWYQGDNWIEPYTGDGGSKLPLLTDVTILHHAHERSSERIAAKAAFYREDHKRRRGQ